eukprot:822438_1
MATSSSNESTPRAPSQSHLTFESTKQQSQGHLRAMNPPNTCYYVDQKSGKLMQKTIYQANPTQPRPHTASSPQFHTQKSKTIHKKCLISFAKSHSCWRKEEEELLGTEHPESYGSTTALTCCRCHCETDSLIEYAECDSSDNYAVGSGACAGTNEITCHEASGDSDCSDPSNCTPLTVTGGTQNHTKSFVQTETTCAEFTAMYSTLFDCYCSAYSAIFQDAPVAWQPWISIEVQITLMLSKMDGLDEWNTLLDCGVSLQCDVSTTKDPTQTTPSPTTAEPTADPNPSRSYHHFITMNCHAGLIITHCLSYDIRMDCPGQSNLDDLYLTLHALPTSPLQQIIRPPRLKKTPLLSLTARHCDCRGKDEIMHSLPCRQNQATSVTTHHTARVSNITTTCDHTSLIQECASNNPTSMTYTLHITRFQHQHGNTHSWIEEECAFLIPHCTVSTRIQPR